MIDPGSNMSTTTIKKNEIIKKFSSAGPLTEFVRKHIEAKNKKSIPVSGGMFNGDPNDFNNKPIPVTIYFFGGSNQLKNYGMNGILISQPPTSTADPDQLAATAVNSFTSKTGIKPSSAIVNKIGFSAGGEKVIQNTKATKDESGKFVSSVSEQKNIMGVQIQNGASIYNDGFHPSLDKDESGNYKSPKLTIAADAAYKAATDPSAPPFVMIFSSVIASKGGKRYTSTYQSARALMQILESKGVKFNINTEQQLTPSGVIIDYYASAGKCSFIGTNQNLLNIKGGYETKSGLAYTPTNDPGSMGDQHVDLGVKGHGLAIDELNKMIGDKVKIT